MLKSQKGALNALNMEMLLNGFHEFYVKYVSYRNVRR